MSQVPAEVPGTGGTGSAGAWPFCVGWGKTTGQAVILAPPFLITAERTFLLFGVTGKAGEHAGSVARAAGDPGAGDRRANDSEPPPGGRLWRCRVSDDTAGEFTTVFLARRATPTMVGGNGEALQDANSRPVYFFAGVVLRDPTADAPAAVFDQAVAVATCEFGAFWRADDKHAPVRAAAPLDVAANPRDQAGPVPPEPTLAVTELPAVTYPPPVDIPGDEPEPGRAEQREAEPPATIGAQPDPERAPRDEVPKADADPRRTSTSHALVITLGIIVAVLALAVLLLATK